MADRRSFLKVLLGAGAIGPHIAIGEAAAVLGVSKFAIAGAPSVFDELSGPASGSPKSAGLMPLNGWRLAQLIRRSQDARSESIERLPVHIRNKKSWSEAFKVGEAAREAAIINAYIELLERDDSFADTVLETLGLRGLLA